MEEELIPPASALAIARYPDENGYYLFGLDEHGDVQSDTWHETIDAAVRQAEFEYEGLVWTTPREEDMGDDRVMDLLDEIQDRVDAPITCPVCGQSDWTLYPDSVLIFRVATLRSIQPDALPPSDDDEWGVFGVGAFCSICGFLRTHVVARSKLVHEKP